MKTGKPVLRSISDIHTEDIDVLQGLCTRLSGKLSELKASITAGNADLVHTTAAEASQIIGSIEASGSVVSAIQTLPRSVTFSYLSDIIITDPSYFIKGDDDWQKTHNGSNLTAIGIKLGLAGETHYGNWQCNVIDDSNGEIIATFATEKGVCCVATQLDIQAYNPAALKDVSRGCFALIKDFMGTVTFIDGNDGLQIIGKGNVNFHTEL